MMSTEYNLCPKCGGVKSLRRPEYNMRVHTSTFKMCSCKPEPAKRHDGDLGEHMVGYEYGDVEIEKILNDLDHPVRVCLNPKEALSLRDWLNQESAELERLAKEQAGE